MQNLILKEARNLGNGILDVSTFVNHQLDPGLMEDWGRELAFRFIHTPPITKVITAETSGIPLAFIIAKTLEAQMIYARKVKPVTLGDCYTAKVLSHTKNVISDLVIAKKVLDQDDRVLIVDDFLGRGDTSLALANLVKPFIIVGFAFLIEKSFEGGRAKLEHFNVPIESLVIITDMSEGKIVFGQQAKGTTNHK